jgi:sugar O-acyltransferase (sialic acid O-acetyltransferase NeuD family)
MSKVVCWGATGHAEVLREALEYEGHSITLLVDNRVLESPLPMVPCVLGEAGLASWEAAHRAEGIHDAVVAIGGVRGLDRLAIQGLLKARGFTILTVIHPRAFVASDAILGEGCQILAMSAVCAGAHLGNSVIVNTRASVDHGCRIGNGVHVGPGATLAGEVVVGDRAFIGAGATILPRLVIGQDAIIGAGAVVIRDVSPGCTVVGVPAAPHGRTDAGA